MAVTKIRDYKCPEGEDKFIKPEILKEKGVSFPEVHLDEEMMYQYAKLQKPDNAGVYVGLPFCHTVEGEALGGQVNYGDDRTGPRAKEYDYQSVEELVEIGDIDFSTGRISKYLSAAKRLVDDGEFVMYEICGPFTIFNILIDPTKVFKALRKDKETVGKVFDRFKEILLSYFQAVKDTGVQAVSYADPTGGANILGPKNSVEYMDMFTYDFLKDVEDLIGKDMIVHLCPKTSLALIDTGKAEFKDIQLPEEMSYGQTFVELHGKESFVGHMCIGKTDRMMSKTKAIKLK